MTGERLDKLPRWIWAAVPLALLVGSVILFLSTDPLKPLGVTAPPVEQLTVEQTNLDDNGIHLKVRANGSQPMRIAQVMVDEAYWRYSQEPSGPLPRLSSAWITIPYPWVKHELHEVTFITHTGITFTHTIEVAQPTPEWNLQRVLAYILLGIYIGVIPVGLGLLFYPWLKTLGARGIQFILALTLGLLAYLFIDTLLEGFELAGQASEAFEGGLLVWLVTGLSFLGIFAVGRSGGKAPSGISLATYLALGIGLHNLGEGLAVGAAMASGEAALGSFLVVGFVLHNVTEGIGIAAPLLDRKTSLLTFVGLTLLAGLPAAVGTLLGAVSYAPHWGAVLFAVGAGAILQVLVEIGAYFYLQARKEEALSAANLAAFLLGVGIMYATALIVTV
ncbi:MAG: ZIP family metal transporter [Balneolaceae bacterium]|nr:ZIP family metal transporter [Balneolaceae bacterium]